MSKMSALNMAMNGNAYKMIEIKKVGLSQFQKSEC